MQVQKYQFRPGDFVVFETDLCEVIVPCKPHTSAMFGGHLVIRPKAHRQFRSLFTADETLETLALTNACEVLMMQELGAQFCNIQDNGNWPFLEGGSHIRRCHVHVYGRREKENRYTGPGSQEFGMSLNFPHPNAIAQINGRPVDDCSTWLRYIQPYTEEQIELIKRELPGLYQAYQLQSCRCGH